MTRAQSKKAKEDLRPSGVAGPSIEINELKGEKLTQAQREDGSLAKAWELAKGRAQLLTRGQSGYRYGVLYRKYKKKKGDEVEEVRQVMVPSAYRARSMSLVHESIVGGHLGVQSR